MSRRHRSEQRQILPDTKYNSILISRFINNIMECGKKNLAEKIVYKAFDMIKKKYNIDPVDTFNTAISNVRPTVEVKSTRIGGANYQVPHQVNDARGNVLAIRWITGAASKRSERSMIQKLSEELFEASNNRGSSVKKRDDTHKMAESNRACAHLAIINR